MENIIKQRVISFYFGCDEAQEIEAGQRLVYSDPIAAQYYSDLDKSLKVWNSIYNVPGWPELDLFVARIVFENKINERCVIGTEEIKNLEIYKITNAYLHGLVRFLKYFCIQEDIAEDILFEVFCLLHNEGQKHKLELSFKRHLFTIAANRAKETFIKMKKPCSLKSRESKGIDSDVTDEVVRALSVCEIVNEDNPRDIYHTVANMPPLWRGILALAYYEDFSLNDIAQIMNTSKDQVKVLLNKAINQILQYK